MSHPADAAIADLAARQWGTLRRDQALAGGWSGRTWQRRLADGVLCSMELDVARFAAAPRSWEQSLEGAVLAGRGVASHRAAARLHGLLRTSAVEILVDTNRRYRGQAITHRSLDLADRDLTEVDGILTTNVVRTLLDLGAVVAESTVEIALDQARDRRMVDMDELLTRFLQVARRGRRGIAKARRVLEARHGDLAPTQSALETLALRVLRAHGLPAPVTQFAVQVRDRRFVLDLAWPDRRVALELDGRVHNAGIRFETDRIRQNLLTLAGWQVLHATHDYVRRYPADLADTVRSALALGQEPAA